MGRIKGKSKFASEEERRQHDLKKRREAYRAQKGGSVRRWEKIKGEGYSGTFWGLKYYAYKGKCQTKGIPFDLTPAYLESIWTEECPVFKEKFIIGDKSMAPSLDRLDPSKGYVQGNVTWISRRANTIKNDASLEDLEKIVDWLKNKV